MAISLQNPLSKTLNPLGNIISGTPVAMKKSSYDWKTAPSPFTKENAPTITGALTGGGVTSTPTLNKSISPTKTTPLKLDKSMVVAKPVVSTPKGSGILVPQVSADSSIDTNIAKQAVSDIHAGMPIEQFDKVYPELSMSKGIFQQYASDVKAGMPVSEGPKHYPELFGTPSTEVLAPKEDAGWAGVKIPSYTPYKEADIEGGDLASMATVRNLGKFGANIVGGASNIVGGIGNMILHPVDTVKGLGTISKGIWDIAGHDDSTPEAKQAKAAYGEIITKKYGSWENFQKAASEDPTAIVGDVLTLISGGAGIAAKGAELKKASVLSNLRKASITGELSSAERTAQIAKAGELGRTAQKIQTGAKFANKLNPYLAAPKLAIGATTGTIGKTLEGVKNIKAGRTVKGIGKAQDSISKGEEILQEAVNPTTRENKAILKRRVQDLQPYIEEGNVVGLSGKNSLENIKSRVDVDKSRALTNMEEYEKTQGVKGTLETQPIIDKLKTDFQEKIGNSYLHPELAKASQEVIDLLTGFGKQVKDGDILKVRRAWDKITEKNKGFMQTSEANAKGEVFGEANKVFREEIRKSNPEYANYLDEAHKTITLSDVLEATLQRRVGQQGGGFIRRGFETGARITGAGLGSIPGYIASEALIQGTKAISSPSFKMSRGLKYIKEGKAKLEKLSPKIDKNGLDNNANNITGNSVVGRETITPAPVGSLVGKNKINPPKITPKSNIVKSKTSSVENKGEVIIMKNKQGNTAKLNSLNQEGIDLAKKNGYSIEKPKSEKSTVVKTEKELDKSKIIKQETKPEALEAPIIELKTRKDFTNAVENNDLSSLKASYEKDSTRFGTMVEGLFGREKFDRLTEQLTGIKPRGGYGFIPEKQSVNWGENQRKATLLDKMDTNKVESLIKETERNIVKQEKTALKASETQRTSGAVRVIGKNPGRAATNSARVQNAFEMLDSLKEDLKFYKQYLSDRTKPLDKSKIIKGDTSNSDILEQYKAQHGNVVNTDDFRKFVGENEGKPASETQEAASKLSKEYLQKLLTENANKGGKFTILAGGGGSGKSGVQKAVGSGVNDVTFDGVFGDYESGMKRINNAIENGFKPEIHFTMRNFEDALQGILGRAISQNEKRGDAFGRTVPYSIARDAHKGARETILQDFGDIPVSIWDNRGAQGTLQKTNTKTLKEWNNSDKIPDIIPPSYKTKIEDAVKDGKLSPEQAKNLLSAIIPAVVLYNLFGDKKEAIS